MVSQRASGCVFILKKFEEVPNEIQLTKAFEPAGCTRRVSIGKYFKTIHDLDDGFGGTTGACEEYTLLRDKPDSEQIAWFGGHTRIGPEADLTWVIICTGSNRYVVKSYHDPDRSPESRDMASHTRVQQSYTVGSTTEESQASQSKTGDSTPHHSHRTLGSGHIFSCTRDQRTCVGSRPNAQGHVDYFASRCSSKPLSRRMFRGITLQLQSSSPNPSSSFRSTPLPAKTTAELETEDESPPTPQGGLLFGRMAEQSFLTGDETKSRFEVCSDHTSINFISGKEQLQHWRQRSRDHGCCKKESLKR